MWRMQIKDLVKWDIRKQQKLILEFWDLEAGEVGNDVQAQELGVGPTWLEQIEIA